MYFCLTTEVTFLFSCFVIKWHPRSGSMYCIETRIDFITEAKFYFGVIFAEFLFILKYLHIFGLVHPLLSYFKKLFASCWHTVDIPCAPCKFVITTTTIWSSEISQLLEKYDNNSPGNNIKLVAPPQAPPLWEMIQDDFEFLILDCSTGFKNHPRPYLVGLLSLVHWGVHSNCLVSLFRNELPSKALPNRHRSFEVEWIKIIDKNTDWKLNCICTNNFNQYTYCSHYVYLCCWYESSTSPFHADIYIRRMNQHSILDSLLLLCDFILIWFVLLLLFLILLRFAYSLVILCLISCDLLGIFWSCVEHLQWLKYMFLHKEQKIFSCNFWRKS